MVFYSFYKLVQDNVVIFIDVFKNNNHNKKIYSITAQFLAAFKSCKKLFLIPIYLYISYNNMNKKNLTYI